MSLLERCFFIVLLLAFVFELVGCQQEPAEKAGKKIDQAVEKVSK
jgi:hypothetical protein